MSLSYTKATLSRSHAIADLRRGLGLGLILAGAVLWASRAGADTLYRFDQPELPLAQALTRMAESAGLSILIEGRAEVARAPALQGATSLEAALATLLAGTGADYRVTTDGRLNVTLPGPATSLINNRPVGEALGTIILSATGHPQHLVDAPATVTTIPLDAPAGRPRARVADLLRDVPGLSLSAPGRDGMPSVTLRGMSQPYVLFMVDGRPLSASEEAAYNGFGTSSKLAFLPPPSALDRIEVIRGPMSALHGSSAAGGVINLITRSTPEAWGGDISLGFGPATDPASGTAREGSFWLGGPLVTGTLSLAVFGGISDRGEDDRRRSGYQSEGIAKGHRSSLGAKLLWIPDDRQELGLSLRQSRLAFNRSARTAQRDLDGRITDRSAALTHRLHWGQGRETASFLQWERSDFQVGNDSGHDALTLNSRTTLGDAQRNLTFGYEYRHERTRHDPDRLPDMARVGLTRWHQALFVEGRMPLGPDAALTLGLRADHNQRYGAAWTPRAALVWHLTPGLTLKTGIGSGYRLPTLKQADSAVAEPSGGNGQSRDLGNSALRPERSTNYEIGLIWNGERGLQLGATLFYSRFTDRISRVDLCRTANGGPPACIWGGTAYTALTRYANEDAARMNGVELTLDLPIGYWDISANYTYSDSKVTRGRTTGARFHTLPLHMLNLSADWQASTRMNLWAGLRGRSKVRAEGRTAAIPAHVIVDLGLGYDVNDRVKAMLAVYNLNDRTEGDVLAEGRRIYIGLNAQF